MNQGMIRFKGHLTAEAPLQVSYPDLDGKLPRTPHGEAFLNGGTLRGPLRKCALRAVRRLLASADGVPEKGLLTLTDEYMLGSGIDRSREVNNEKAEGADPVGEQLLRKVNPLLSLFGRWNLPSRLECSELRTDASNVITAGQGVRHDQFARDPDAVEILSDDDKETLLREARSARESALAIEEVRRELAKTKRAYGAASDAGDKAETKRLGALINELKEKEKTARADREGAEHSIQHPLSGFEAIAPGSRLSARLGLINGRQAYLGIILHALAEFAREPVLGGHRNIGAGLVSGAFDVFQWTPGELQATKIGSVRFDDLGFHIEGDTLQAAFDAVADPATLKAWNLHTHTIAAARELKGGK